MRTNKSSKKRAVGGVVILSLAGVMLSGVNCFSENDYAGLWVGSVALSKVTEVVVPLDEDNIPIAPDPNTPTATHDEAYLRLILHVNGVGQVNLLRDVAILSQSTNETSGSVAQSESDYVLVTDDRLYADFPQQEAIRIASVVFDFGDRKATDAVDRVVDAIVEEVASSVDAANLVSTSSDTALRAAEDAAQLAAETEADRLIVPADVNEAFDEFLRTELPSGALTTLATTEPLNLTALSNNAVVLRDASFYQDTRALRLLQDLDVAVNAATNGALKRSAAHSLVSRYADIENKYQRFITGRSLGDMIVDAAQLAATAAEASNSVSDAVNAGPSVLAVRTEAINTQVAAYEDTAASNAVETVISAIINSATNHASTLVSVIAVDAERAGLSALENDVPRYALQVQAPTDDYTAFVTSESFADSVSIASRAAALAAVKEAKNDPFYSQQTLKNAAKIAAVQAITVVYSEAARARQTELPMDGVFAPGAENLTGVVYLPASHPTNPFRHRRHPDHTVGFDIQRNLRIDFDAVESNQLTRVSFGVDQISGIYREEIFGLHKLLGPDSDIGLKVEGTFELNRISHIDTLNSL